MCNYQKSKTAHLRRFCTSASEKSLPHHNDAVMVLINGIDAEQRTISALPPDRFRLIPEIT